MNARPLNPIVLAILDDLAVIKGRAALPVERLDRWSSELSKPGVRAQHRVFLDCVEAAMRLERAKQSVAAAQLLLLSAIGLNDGKRAQARREGGDVFARMRPSRFSVTC